MKKSKPPSNTKSEEYQNFQKLFKAVVAVPKSELDKREAEYQRKKAVKKKKAA
jgi:hypothetical protein